MASLENCKNPEHPIVPPDNTFVAGRITATERGPIEEALKSFTCVISEQEVGTLRQGQHYHFLVLGVCRRTVSNAFAKYQSGRATKWSKDAYDFPKILGYTIKQGPGFVCYGGFEVYLPLARKWVPGSEYVRTKSEHLKSDCDETSWQLTDANILRVAKNWRDKQQMDTDDLFVVLQSLCKATKWQPSRFVREHGLERWHYQKFKSLCELDAPEPTDWMHHSHYETI